MLGNLSGEGLLYAIPVGGDVKAVTAGVKGAVAVTKAATIRAIEKTGTALKDAFQPMAVTPEGVRIPITSNPYDKVLKSEGDRSGGVGGAGKVTNPEISKKVDKALKSSDPGIKLEGEVADALGNNVTSSQKKIDEPGKPRAGEIDVETDKYIIEVTTGKSSKTASEFDKYFVEPINTEGKQVQSKGVIVIKDLDELKKIIGVN